MRKDSTEVKTYSKKEEHLERFNELFRGTKQGTTLALFEALLLPESTLLENVFIKSLDWPLTTSSSELPEKQKETPKKKEELEGEPAEESFDPVKFLSEAKKCIDRKDPVQGSEKLYKVVEYCIKEFAKKYNLSEYKEAKREGTWWTKLLARSARTLANKLNENRIIDVWTKAFELHQFGFHENSLRTEDVKREIPLVEWFLGYMKSKLGR